MGTGARNCLLGRTCFAAQASCIGTKLNENRPTIRMMVLTNQRASPPPTETCIRESLASKFMAPLETRFRLPSQCP